ncbi:ribonuclease H-like protein [Cytidiella melzeri]|nr:ribonuclease H-like protein [Cytidiella melzeri]
MSSQYPWLESRDHHSPSTPVDVLTVYTDGSCLNNGAANARARAGIWYGTGDPRNLAIRVPGPTQTNQAGEVLAIQHVAALTPPSRPLHIISDSRYAIDGLTTHLQKWRDRGWTGVDNADISKSAVTTFEWVKGHSDSVGNDGADELASQGTQLEPPTDIDLWVPNNWNLTGVKAASLTQAIVYTRVRMAHPPEPRPVVEENLDKTLYCVHNHLGGTYPHRGRIWKSLRHKDISRKISDFLWRVMHNSLKVGKFWAHIPNLEERSTCHLCDEEDTINRILAECVAPECLRIWALCKHLWNLKASVIPWLGKHLGNLLGAPLADFTTPDGKRQPGLSRLYRIMMTESAHLIWRLRCERRIDRKGETHSLTEIDRKWLTAMNMRVTMDSELTKPKYGKRKLPKHVVLRTWSNILDRDCDLPLDWIDHRVFSGWTQSRHVRGSNRLLHKSTYTFTQ